MSERVIRQIIISGEVQGVGFRAWLEGKANQEGVDGWVRNRRGGHVEALLAGPPQAVQAIIDACQAGPPMARVARVDVSEAAGVVPRGFQQRPTI